MSQRITVLTESLLKFVFFKKKASMSFQILIFLIRKPFDAIFAISVTIKFILNCSQNSNIRNENDGGRAINYTGEIPFMEFDVSSVRVRISDADGGVNAAAARDDVAQGII